jgi:predicted RNase H-like HicB family nuclease
MRTSHRGRFDADPQGGYLVTCPNLPEMVAGGKTLRAARVDAHRQIVGCLEDLADLGKPLLLLIYAPSWRVRQRPKLRYPAKREKRSVSQR